MLAMPWHCPRLYLPSPLVSACGCPLTLQASTAHAAAGLNSMESDRKVTALHQQSVTDRTAGPQSLFLYFLMGLYTPALRASSLKPYLSGAQCLRGLVFDQPPVPTFAPHFTRWATCTECHFAAAHLFPIKVSVT